MLQSCPIFQFSRPKPFSGVKEKSDLKTQTVKNVICMHVTSETRHVYIYRAFVMFLQFLSSGPRELSFL